MYGNIISVVSLFMSIIAIVVTVYSWKASRKIHGIEIRKIAKDEYLKESLGLLNRRLSIGKYSILNISETKTHYSFVLGNVARKDYYDKVLSST